MIAERSSSSSKVLFLTLFTLMTFVIVASYLLVLLMGYGFIFFTPEGLALSMRSYHLYILLFLWIGFYTPIAINAGAAFSFIWIVYVLCFIAAWKWRENFHEAVRKAFSRPFRSLFDNFLFIMPLISSMLLVAVLAIIYSQQFVGVPTGEVAWPEGAPLQEIFFQLAYAPLVEELGFRLIPVGLFTIFYILLIGKNIAGRGVKLYVAALFYPEGAKKMAGLKNVSEHGIWRGISVGEWTMIFSTAVIFAFAHLISGIGWEIGKVTSVFVQGFFFALTYLAYGFEAPVLLHWYFNYYLFFFDSDILSKFFPATDAILAVVELLILALGILGWTVFGVAGLRRFFRPKETEQEVPVPPTILPS